MSDTINALQMLNQPRGGGTLPAPVLVNPLAAQSAGMQVANQAFQLRQSQAQQAWGQALQQATDPTTGVVDFNRAQSIAAQNPAAAMGMATNLQNTSSIKGQQLEQVSGLYNLIGRASASLMNDPSDANVQNIRGSLTSAGAPPAALAELDRIQALPVNQRVAEAYKHNLAATDAQSQLGRGGFPSPTLQNAGGAIVGTGVTPPSPYSPGSVNVSPGGVPITPSPGEYLAGGGSIHYPATQADVDAGRAKTIGQDVIVPGAEILRRAGIPVPPGLQTGGGTGSGGGGGVVDSSGKPVGPGNPPRLLNTPGQTATTSPGSPGASTAAPGRPLPLPPPPSPGAPPAASGAPPAAVPAPASPAVPAPAAPPPAAAPPAVSAPASVPSPTPTTTPPPYQRPFAALQGGVQVASTNQLAPNLGPPSAPSPLVPGDVNAIVAGMNRGAATPSTGPQTAFNSIAVGPGAEEAEGYKASAQKLASDSMAAANFQNTQFPYVQALKTYGEGTTTGPTTDFWNQVAGTIRTPLAKLGVNIGSLDDNTQRQDALGKWLANIQSGNPMSGKSDAELAQVLKGSASQHINETTGADMVKAGLTLQRMQVAATREWQSNPAAQQQFGTYLNFLGNYNQTVDPRAFSVDTLNDAQKMRLQDQLRSGGEANAARFNASLGLARRNGMIGGAGSQAMP